MTSIFAGKKDETQGEEPENFEKKMEKSNYKKGKGPAKDRIINDYGNVLAMGKRAKEYGEKLLRDKAENSKSIKKNQRKLKKGDISEAEVRNKMKQKRVVLPTRALK